MSRLGAGGMGQVYKAQHQRMRRIVALKVLPIQADITEKSVRRFSREVQAAARLSHPNIVTAYDAGEQQGVHYLVMEYVAGRDLSTFVREHGPLDLESALDCILQAARGLEYAHGEGIIHRDIKPSNLLIDKRGVVKILDMGIARFDDALGGENGLTGAGLTRTEQIMGTIDYMSPEQAEDTRCADARSDIYSLGCTLFSLLTGTAPYEGDTAMRKLLAHRTAEIPSLKAQLPDVPKEVDQIFQRMVAKRPEDRFQSMTDVIAALESCRASLTTAVGLGAGGGLSQSGGWNLAKSTGTGSALRAAAARSRSQEPTVELRSAEEETTPRIITILVGTVHRNPVVAVASLVIIALLGVVGVWFATWPGSSIPTDTQNVDGAQTAAVVAEQKAMEPPAQSPIVAPPSPSKENEWLDVLSLLDLEKQPPLRGIWSRDDRGLHYAADAGTVGVLALPLVITGSHRWQIELSGMNAAGLGQFLVFPVGNSWVRLLLDGGRNQDHLCGLERVNGYLTSAEENPTTTSFHLEPNKKYLLQLDVRIEGRQAEVGAKIGDEKLFNWKGPAKDLSLGNPPQANGYALPKLLGVRPFSIYSIRLQTLDDGRVKLLSDPPANLKLPKFVRPN